MLLLSLLPLPALPLLTLVLPLKMQARPQLPPLGHQALFQYQAQQPSVALFLEPAVLLLPLLLVLRLLRVVQRREDTRKALDNHMGSQDKHRNPAAIMSQQASLQHETGAAYGAGIGAAAGGWKPAGVGSRGAEAAAGSGLV